MSEHLPDGFSAPDRRPVDLVVDRILVVELTQAISVGGIEELYPFFITAFGLMLFEGFHTDQTP
ncbi:MAG: hypothetical protein R3275_08055 [Saprospiraceae bacterium]|nr:hypothetical protein [Saprospiraceae bacterium]